MPNRENAQSPITLVGPGRSGTSLVAALFDRHPDSALVGETVNTIFDVWDALDFSSASGPPLIVDGEWLPDDERCARAVRAVMAECYPSAQPRWFQKPIGVPRFIQYRYRDPAEWERAAVLYWRVLRSSFPDAKWFTVLRHPCDVVLSAGAHWGYSPSVVWWHFGLLATAIAHDESPVEFALGYEELVRDPEENVRALMSHVDMEFRPELLSEFGKVHAGSRSAESARRSGSRHEERSRLDPEDAPPHVRIALERLYARFGKAFEWPEHFLSGSARERVQAAVESGRPEPAESEVVRLNRVVQQQNKRISELNEELFKQRRELTRLRFNAEKR